MGTHNLCFVQEGEENQNFYLKVFIFGGKVFSIFEYACFHNGWFSNCPIYSAAC